MYLSASNNNITRFTVRFFFKSFEVLKIFYWRKGTIESQRAICNNTCVATIQTENISQVILFTFTHIPKSFNVSVFTTNVFEILNSKITGKNIW